MKLLFAFLLSTVLGLGGLRAMSVDGSNVDAASSDCNVTVECTNQGSCIIRCEMPGGEICEMEVVCDPPDCTIKSCKGGPCPEPAGCR